MHVAVAHDAAHVQHLRERESGRREGEPRSSHRVACRARDALIAASEAAREKSMAFDFAERFRRTLPTLTTVASASSEIATVGARFARPLARSFVHSRASFCSVHPLSCPALASVRLGSARLRLAWLGLDRLRLGSPNHALVRSSTRRFERARTITFGVTRLSTSARANHGRLRRAARWRLRRLWVRNARPPPLLPPRVRRFLFVTPFHPLYPASSLARSLARTPSAPRSVGGGDRVKTFERAVS